MQGKFLWFLRRNWKENWGDWENVSEEIHQFLLAHKNCKLSLTEKPMKTKDVETNTNSNNTNKKNSEKLFLCNSTKLPQKI